MAPFLIALLALPLLLWLPGMLVSRAVPGAIPPDLLEHRYEQVITGTLLHGWLAFVLAEVGVFSLWLHLALVGGACLALWLWQRTRSPSPAPAPAPVPESSQHRDRLLFALAGLAALLLVLPPFEVILGVRDAGVYANTGFATARNGGLVQYDTLLAELGQAAQSDDPAVQGPAQQALSNFLGVQHPERFIATRMRAAGFFINEGEVTQGRVVPQGFHLFPTWIALLASMGGLVGGLFAPGLFGVLGAWSAGMLGRTLAGRWVGILAFVLLALNSVQVWFSRYSTSETTTQFLTLAGLYCFAKAHQPPPPGQSHMSSTSTNTYYAALAGVAFGQLALTRIDFVLVVVPVLLYLLFCWLSHRWHRVQTALAVGLGAMLLHAGLHIIFIARAYFFDTAYARLQDYAITAYLSLPFITPLLREVYHTRTASQLKDPLALWRELAVIGVVVGGLLVLWRWPRPIHAIATLAQRWQRGLAALAALLILVLATYAYLVRPQILNRDVLAAAPSCLSLQQLRQPEGACLALQGYVGAPIALPPPPPAPDPQRVRDEEPYRFYEGGLNALLSHMGADNPRYNDALGYKRQLLDNIAQAQQADTPDTQLSLQHERARLIAQLDDLSNAAVGVPFEELCNLNVFAPKIDDKYLVPLANLVRVGWYLSPLGVLLGVVGFALWWWRGLNRASWLFLLVGLVGTFFFVRQTYGTSDQTYIYILRRFVSVSYPALSLGMAYALVALAHLRPARWPLLARLARASACVLALALVVFLAWTGRPIYRHVEYAGALDQLGELAAQFEPDDVLLLRGGGPTYGHFRDVPDIVATPLHFTYGLHAFTVKSGEPSRYADALAAQVQRWHDSGRQVYVLLSASGGDMVLPGFAMQPVGTFTLHLPEYEQLTDQKPRNVASLRLPLTLYRLQQQEQEQDDVCCPTSIPPPLTATDFAAQVQGFYLPEPGGAQPAGTSGLPDNLPYAWTNGNALLRIPWHGRDDNTNATDFMSSTLTLVAAGGERPAHLGPAEVCLSVLPEAEPWPATPGTFTPLGCATLERDMAAYQFRLPSAIEGYGREGTALLRIESSAWVPAIEDPRMVDRRVIGVQFGGLDIQAGAGATASP